MKRKIALFGGSLLEEVRFENNTFNILNNKTVIKLKNKYDIDNYSYKGLNSDKVLRLVRNLNVNELYNTCIIALGEYEINEVLFEYNLNKIIAHLLANNVRPILVGILNNETLQNIVCKVAIENNVEYTLDALSNNDIKYEIKEQTDNNKTKLKLC